MNVPISWVTYTQGLLRKEKFKFRFNAPKFLWAK